MTWASGSNSAVRLTPPIPAIRATANTSPFGTAPSRSAAITCGAHRTSPVAVASRTVGSFAVTSTIRAWPVASRWVNGCSVIDPPG
jgi:hypothetical protein